MSCLQGMGRVLPAVVGARQRLGNSGRQGSEAAEAGTVLLWAMRSHGRLLRMKAPGRQRLGDPTGPQTTPGSPHPCWFLVALLAHRLGMRAWMQLLCREWRCGRWRRSRGHVLRSLVSGPAPGSCGLAWPQVPHPLGLSSLRRNAVPGQGGQQGQGTGLKPTPTPTTLGTVWRPAARPWE